jgi:glycosyltransferase involved in cell wall biosynthesis
MSYLPKITIVTPSYNQAIYLEQTLKSVLDQNYPNLEYIVMDGGSTDGSVEIIKSYADRLDYWESQADKGQADAIYRGFERATGDIVGFVNSDDLLLQGTLFKVGYWFASHPHEEWVVGGCVIIGADGEPKRDRLGNPCCIFGGHVTFRRLLFWGCGFNQPASFWRRSVFFEIGGFDRSLTHCFDYDLYFRLAKRRPSGKLNEILAAFRIHSKSKTSTLFQIRKEEDEKLYERYGRLRYNKLFKIILSYWFGLIYKVRARYHQILLVLKKHYMCLDI